MAVIVHTRHPWLLPLERRVLVPMLEAMLRAATLEEMPVTLHVVRDGSMAWRNNTAMGCQGPTNILSFPSSVREGGKCAPSGIRHAEGVVNMPGLLLLSADTFHRECLLYDQLPMEHLTRLLAHGLAHLTGMDHGPAMDALSYLMEKAGIAFVESSS